MGFKPRVSWSIGLLFALFLTVTSIAQAPGKDYAKEWKQVDELIKKQLPKSALEKLKVIYLRARNDKQDAQLIKALVYRIALQNENTENSDANAIAGIEKEAASASEPARSILNSLIAEAYWSYYQRHRWQLYNRTNTQNFKKDDIATWTADDLHKQIGASYLSSIKNAPLLQQTRLAPYNAIILQGNVRHLRPTLFDLLAHRALEYFQSDEREISRPAYAFEIADASAFDAASDFAHHPFRTRDSASLEHKALLLYQQLIAFHLDDLRPDALIDVDLARIQFVNEKGVQPDKKELYLAALRRITGRYGDLPAAAQAWYLIARQHNEDASTYQPYGDTTYRYDKIKAKQICEKVLEQKDSSEGKTNCYNLLNEITAKDLKFQLEKVNIPGQPFRALIQYKNVSQLHLRLIRADGNMKDEEGGVDEEDFWKQIINAEPLRRWDQGLPPATDMQEHAAEIKIDALSSGEYFLLISSEQNFAAKNSLLGARLFYVSNISYVNSGADYFVLHRETGKPLVNAAVQVWQQRYDYKTSKYLKEKGTTYKTDNKGFFRLERKTPNSGDASVLLDISYNGERLIMNDAQDQYYYNYDSQNTSESTAIFLFTDRSIYRPGQTLYFKGIAIATVRAEKRNIPKTNYETMVYLRNANYQLTDSMKVVTNDYGSFSGKFQLPQSGLNGEFTLLMKDNRGSANFSVEEYKRPKFYVDFDKLKGTYKVGDRIKIAGIAKAFAGENIDGAAVKYRVVRKARFIYDWLSWRWWQPPTREMEIAHGEIKTGKDGKFEIEFTAIPDLSIEKSFDPVFDYAVYADVTDRNGETRSGQAAVSVSYKGLLLTVDLAEKIPVDSFRKMSISTTNLAGEFEPSKVSVRISRLRDEKKLIRARYWQRPDQFVMSREEYEKWFPFDEYNNEADYRSWQKEKLVFEKTDSVRQNTEFSIQDLPASNNGPQLVPGLYIVEIATRDKEGQEVKDEEIVELYDERSSRLDHPQYLWTEGSKAIEPGEKTSVTLGSSASDLIIIEKINKSQDDQQPTPGSYSVIHLSDEKKTFEFTATDNDRGGFGVNYFFVRNNRFYEYSDVIQVPWTNKDLAIEYATFRDKTLPGSEETWKVKIGGYKNEKVTAEMLASMYDASLDQFRPHSWYRPSIWTYFSNHTNWSSSDNFSEVESEQKAYEEATAKYLDKRYDVLLGSALGMAGGSYLVRPVTIRLRGIATLHDVNKAQPETALEGRVAGVSVSDNGKMKNEEVVAADTSGVGQKPENDLGKYDVQIRRHFNETAFFFPDLYTDSTGAIGFSFTMPEALTKWKLQTFAHTKDLAFGLSSADIVTQKQLMVQPNAPRFLREGDRMEFSTKIVNLTDSEITGQAQLQLVDATTGQSVDGWFQNMFPNQYFTVAAGQSEGVKFPIQVPYLFNKALAWRIVAKAGEFSDGEENAMPVLTNKTLVTETLPLNTKGPGTKNFTFDKLLHVGESETLQNEALTIEYTSSPAWYAVQSLPYMVEYPYECAEQTWNRYYANSLAAMIANSSPRIREVFERWKTKDTSALLSNLQKNQELKSVLLEETPWVLEAKSEEQQKRNIALLFDMVKMSTELNSSLEKLRQMQSENGGFVWFKGGPDDRYITQYIVAGIGHLKALHALAAGQDEKLRQVLTTAIPYLDKKIKEDYENLLKYKTDLKKYTPGYLEIQYLYMRSFFPEFPIAKSSQAAYVYFRKRSQSSWTGQGKYMQGMMALALFRTGDLKTPVDILRSLKETAIVSEELGMYWKNPDAGWFWYQAPIETQSLLIEAFQEIGKDSNTVDDLKTWLLKNKQTVNWSTTKSTAEACYALLLGGSDWLSGETAVTVTLGSMSVTNAPAEEGTGYFKKTVEGEKINSSMGHITVTATPAKQQAASTSWGAVYWQYFEDLDKITPAATPLKLSKKLFIEKNTDHGPVLTPVNEGDELRVGDKIKVRIELRVDRDMEYVHMKDMRASCLEPVNVLSAYKWQDGLGYYESTKDASTNFFFSYLRKGTYVFEYPLFITHAGNFSNGITTIQCMYAPEFSSHSEGIRISVNEQ